MRYTQPRRWHTRDSKCQDYISKSMYVGPSRLNSIFKRFITPREASDFNILFLHTGSTLSCNTIFRICWSYVPTRGTCSCYAAVWTMCSCNLTLETSTRCSLNRHAGIFFWLSHQEKGLESQKRRRVFLFFFLDLTFLKKSLPWRRIITNESMARRYSGELNVISMRYRIMFIYQ